MKYFLSIIIFLLILIPSVSSAGIISDLQVKITDRTREILKLEKEIKEYHEELDRTSNQAKGLDNAIGQLKLTDKKLVTDIRLTENRIIAAVDTISSLKFDIDITGARIVDNTKALSGAIQERYELEAHSLIEILLAYPRFSSFWSFLTYIENFQSNIKTHVTELKELKIRLEEKEKQMVKERANLLSYKGRLVDQKDIVLVNKNSKERLLEQTRNKESLYENLLEERLQKKEALEQEIAEFEERLRVEIDPDSLPRTGSGILIWPFKEIFVTQYFGNTPFASANSQVYNGLGHNGIDLRGSVGTQVMASANGVVVNTGNTDDQCYKVSYGKWILIRHYTGISTLYAHLSLTRVNPGDEVKQGEIIGYSGNSGYSTGPHLHFGAYASAAVRISEPTGPNKYESKVCGTYLKLPLSARNGYLNPLSYLKPEPDK